MNNRNKFSLLECFIEKFDRFLIRRIENTTISSFSIPACGRQAIFNSKAVALLLKTTRSDG